MKVGGVCAVKEYFPANFALRTNATKFVSVAEQNLQQYNKIMGRFVEEAELVRSLHHKNIVTIYDSFFENNTAYYVMEYCDGVDLRNYTNNFSRKLEYREGLHFLYQVMDGLEYIHAKGILHRDIAPDNIYVTKSNLVKILDFGSARKEMQQWNQQEFSVIVKMGYAPIEQYGGRGKQGPYTDIYALGATFYHLFTGRIPIESTERVTEDRLIPFSRLRPDLPDQLKYCIEKAMEITKTKRIADIPEMKRILGVARFPVKNPPVSKPPVSKLQFAEPRPYLPVASIASRMGAYLVDVMLWGSLYFVALFGILGVNRATIGLSTLFPVLLMLINTVSELITATTIGKAIFRMYISGKRGTEVMPSQVLMRNIIKLLGVFVAVFARNDELLEDRATDCFSDCCKQHSGRNFKDRDLTCR